jgi:hypothetical protein
MLWEQMLLSKNRYSEVEPVAMDKPLPQSADFICVYEKLPSPSIRLSKKKPHPDILLGLTCGAPE